MAELTADLFVTLDGFAAGENVGPFFGYGGTELDGWVREMLSRPHLVVMGRVTYEALAAISDSATDEISTEPVFADWPRAGLELADVRVLDGRLVMLEYRLAR